MSKSERIKEELGLRKFAIGALLAVAVSLVAWLAQSYRAADPWLLWLAAVCVVALAAAMIGTYLAIPALLRKLEES